MAKLTKKTIYWAAQFLGWGAYIALAIFQIKLSGESFDHKIITSLFVVFSIGILATHLYRIVFIRLGWLNLGIKKLALRIIAGSVVAGICFETIFFISEWFLESPEELKIAKILQEFLSWSLLIFMWSLVYFVFHFFENFRKEEIKNLKWEASKTEFELNKLKSQLNPHFIFNSMNTIKALVDDEPLKAKDNITKLSNILRNTLLMGKKETIPFSEELNLIKDYLDLEHSRFEERLKIEYNIDQTAYNYMVPPMMLQTLVENGIKHGISKLPEGGKIVLNAKETDNHLDIKIFNSGTYSPTQKTDSGLGLENSKQRLQLMYDNNALLEIKNIDKGVQTHIIIPKQL